MFPLWLVISPDDCPDDEDRELSCSVDLLSRIKEDRTTGWKLHGAHTWTYRKEGIPDGHGQRRILAIAQASGCAAPIRKESSDLGFRQVKENDCFIRIVLYQCRHTQRFSVKSSV